MNNKSTKIIKCLKCKNEFEVEFVKKILRVMLEE